MEQIWELPIVKSLENMAKSPILGWSQKKQTTSIAIGPIPPHSWINRRRNGPLGVACLAPHAMVSWIYDLGWSALLTLRQGPKEQLGARETLGIGMSWDDRGVPLKLKDRT